MKIDKVLETIIKEEIKYIINFITRNKERILNISEECDDYMCKEKIKELNYENKKYSEILIILEKIIKEQQLTNEELIEYEKYFNTIVNNIKKAKKIEI